MIKLHAGAGINFYLTLISFDTEVFRNPARQFTCAEKQNIGKRIVLHAVIKMVESTHRSRLTGGGFKSPKGAVVKSPRKIGAGYGTERLGKG
jgi:hypothetical protein